MRQESSVQQKFRDTTSYVNARTRGVEQLETGAGTETANGKRADVGIVVGTVVITGTGIEVHEIGTGVDEGVGASVGLGSGNGAEIGAATGRVVARGTGTGWDDIMGLGGGRSETGTGTAEGADEIDEGIDTGGATGVGMGGGIKVESIIEKESVKVEPTRSPPETAVA
jgi:hypothetical protein